MRLSLPNSSLALLLLGSSGVDGFSSSISSSWATRRATSPLFVSIGLGPDEETKERSEMVAGVDYEIPNHEEYRLSQRSKFDEQCDVWYGQLLGEDNGVLGPLAVEARKILNTPVPLENEIRAPVENKEEYTPYVTTRLPWTPITPAFGVEEYGLPIPRRNAETWRHFDVVGMVEQDYSTIPDGTGSPLELSEDEVTDIADKLKEKGGWLDDDSCSGRLVYIDGRFAPQLSMTNDVAQSLDSTTNLSDEVKTYLARLTDGFTDELAAPVVINDEGDTWSSYKKLSGPDHCIGEATSQFAINSQQGTACFAALNTARTGAVAYVHAAANQDEEIDVPKPVLIVNAVTSSGSAGDAEEGKGVAFHPRTLVVADEGSRLSVVQSCVDLDSTEEAHRPKLYNGYTQLFVKENANLTHSYLEESGGIVTGGVEQNDDDIEEGMPNPREVESQRPALKDTHLEAIDVHIVGKGGAYQGTMMGLGGSGRARTAMSVTLLRPETTATINGFALSGGAQRTDMKTNIHHIADDTVSRQVQKNMIGGRATGAFRGRIRVEQSAQLTDSEQLSRTILLSDRSRAWAVPSLEIIADDVTCAHGATVSDLSEEELFYLRSRGLTTAIARNLLMYAFAGDISACVDPTMLGAVDSQEGLQKRVIQRLENLVPRGQRAIKGEYQSV
ncbi:UPF0051 protein slr0076 [Seminavis robusta]|uniref:UPF0051 protein slr0076 n=1 Tax=Seminavis robusta TaxID=568900 RepID=A0A9N8DHK8_9STRA|nr:UPF0051 protein slr0076 [Seminavis robusta]|eukprot:Sro94_g048910.1 UPF0051 protein slr0076 (671) ;mRNA; r:33104-35332